MEVFESFPGGGFLADSDAWQCRRPEIDPWVRKIPWRREWLPTPMFLPREFIWSRTWQLSPVLVPEKSHGQRSLMGLQSMGSQRVRHSWARIFTSNEWNYILVIIWCWRINLGMSSISIFRMKDEGFVTIIKFFLKVSLVCLFFLYSDAAAAAAAKSLQSCPTLCDPRDGSPPGSPVPGILQARTVEWVAISFSNAWKWKVKVKSLSHVRLLATPWTAAYQAPLSRRDFPGKSTRVGCHCPTPLK